MVRYEIDAEALSASFVVLWELFSAEASGLSPAECVQKSAAEWAEESEALSGGGSLSEALRCVVRATLWECLSYGYSVWEAAQAVEWAVRDWRAFHHLVPGEVYVVEVDGVAGGLSAK
jgi:hypothetical protein